VNRLHRWPAAAWRFADVYLLRSRCAAVFSGRGARPHWVWGI